MSDTARVPRRRSWPPLARRRLLDALHLTVLASFAFAQPIFDLLGEHPTFFVAHATGPGRVVAWTVLLLALPPIALLVIEALVAIASEQARRVVHVGFVGLLAGLTIVPPLARGLDLGATGASLALLGLGGGAAFAYGRWNAARSLVTWAAPAPVVFAALFLFASPVSDIVFPSEAGAYTAAVEQPAPVVMVVLDELPVAALMAPDGSIDAARYPSFARLADQSTWYPNATTVSGFTPTALPAIVSGRVPDPSARPLPTSTRHPDTLFTLLGDGYDLVAHEAVTRLCPQDLCGGTSTHPAHDDIGSLVEDTGIVYLHSTLPDSTAEEYLPALEGRWAGFADGEATVTDDESGAPAAFGADDPRGDDFWHDADESQLERLGAVQDDEVSGAVATWATFVAGIEPSARPWLSFLHVNIPHEPYLYLPDGTRYDRTDLPGLTGFEGTVWADDEVVTEAALQRFLLQLQFTDTLVGRLLDRLEETGLLDEAMVVVTADHGASFAPSGFRRVLDPRRGNEAEIMAVPLFVRYPGQAAGRTDTRNAQLVDLVPTVADVLGVDLPWEVDGVSLLDTPASEKRFSDSVQRAELTYPARLPGVQALADSISARFGTPERPGDLFAMGPQRDLVHHDLDELRVGSTDRTATVELDDPDVYADVEPDGELLPARLTATVDGLDEGTDVAVALDGTIAGVGRVFVDRGSSRIAVMLDPEVFAPGANHVAVFAVDDTGTLTPIDSSASRL